jgi:dipeptidyl aminopeptidase/acylaminoacyl peptidase
VVRQSFSRPPEVYAGPLGAWSQLTHRNDGVTAPWGEPRKLRWTSDGAQVSGWLLAPSGAEPGHRYPMVVWVHGGPAGAFLPSFSRTYGALASQGFYVFLPNPRGSFGEGEAFTRGNVKDFGYGDLRDILRGVDAAVKTAPVDAQRLGIAGWSYGGFMAMWAVTQTHRFRAAMAGAGISNWQSYYGQNRIDTWMLPYFGASVYDAPQLYARSSPINFIKQVKTPTLVLQGERDSEVPAPQSYEFWHALKALGVDTQLMIYADEGHAPRKPENQRDLVRRTAAWFDKYLAPVPAPGKVQPPR